MDKLVNFQFTVEGMMCQKNCAGTVQKALENVELVKQAKVTFSTKLAEVWLSPETVDLSTELKLLESIECVGFDAKCIVRPDSVNIPNYQFQVEGMMCQKSCATTVKNSLLAVNGVRDSIVTFSTKSADIWIVSSKYFGDEMKSSLLDAIESVGFSAQCVSQHAPSRSYVTIAEKVDDDNDNNNNNMDDVDFNDGNGEPDVILIIKGMISQNECPKQIELLLGKIDGVMSVNVSYNKSLANVYGFADANKMIDVLVRNGYFASAKGSLNDKNKNQKKVNITSETKPDDGIEYDDYLELKILGMSCANCSKGIEKEISVLRGVQSIKIALLAQKAEIVFNAGIVSSNSIIAAIVELGYEAFFILTKNKKEPNRKELTFYVMGMSSTSCVSKIENEIYNRFTRRVIFDVAITLANNKMVVNISKPMTGASQKAVKHVGPRDILDLVISLGYGCKYVCKADLNKDTDDDSSEDVCAPVVCNPCATSSQLTEIQSWARLLIFAAIFGIPVMFMHLVSPHIAPLKSFLMERNETVCRGTMSIGQTIMILLNVPIQFGVGYKFYRSAYLGALHYNFGMDFLIVLGTSITFLYSVFSVLYACTNPEVVTLKHLFFDASGMLFLFVTLGKFFEAYAKGKTVSAISTLLQLQPLTACLVEENPQFNVNNLLSVSGQDVAIAKAMQAQNEVLRYIEIDLVQKGDILKILPGARVPTDGVILSGSSSLDESMITGESFPLSKAAGDLVFGSTINITNVLYIEVTAVSEENALAQIISLVESAQTNKAPIQAYADRMATLFTPVVLSIAFVTFSVWFVCCAYIHVVPSIWYEEEFGNPLLFSMLFGISVVVISCPCALGLATPTAIMVGSALSAQNGVLIKGGPAFEVANKINTVIFDKTGTLTIGKPVLTNVVVLHSKMDETEAGGINSCSTQCYDFDFQNEAQAVKVHEQINQDRGDVASVENAKYRIIKLAASIEQGSQHPLAQAILNAAAKLDIPLYPLELNDGVLDPSSSQQGQGFRVINGMGVECHTPEGTVGIGNRAFFEKAHNLKVSAQIDREMHRIERQGKTAVCVSLNNVIIGVMGIADAVKPDAAVTIAALHALHIDVWMVTGDNHTTANAIARQLFIPVDRVIAGVLPAEKAAKVVQLQNAGDGAKDRRYVAMVGDGINDSPALAQADLGIALGAGTQVAIEAADMVLIKDCLQDVVVALDLAKFVFQRIRINFGWAVVYNIIAIPFAAGVWYPWTHMLISPQYAGLAMAFSSVSVVLSSLALKLYKRPEHLFKDRIDEKKGNIFEQAKRLVTSRSQATAARPEYSKLPLEDGETDDETESLV